MPPSADATPWRTMLAAALRLGVPPRAFWRLSLREWRALIAPTDTALSRQAFEAMTQMFPDQSA